MANTRWPFSMILFVLQGDLKTYLQRNENDKISVLRRGLVVQTACELASAIDYLHAKDIPWRYEWCLEMKVILILIFLNF